MQESRIFKTIYYLLQKGKSTVSERSKQFEVSIRRIYQDIDTINSAGIPIYTTHGKGSGIVILDTFTHAVEHKDSNEFLIKLSALFQIRHTNWIEVDFFH